MNGPGLLRLLVTAILAAAAGAPVAGQPPPRRPNIVLVITDDQGYGDVGVHGSPRLRTPHRDRLARDGARFDAFCVSPVCAPSRASLLTGRYNYRTGAVDAYLGRALMHPDGRTLPEMLSAAGYRTGIFGKWHLGDSFLAPGSLLSQSEPTRPNIVFILADDLGYADVGFNGGREIATPHLDRLAASGARLRQFYVQPVCTPTPPRYSTHLLAREAVKFVDSQTSGRPFFLYVPFDAAHAPHQVPEAYTMPYRHLDEPRRTYAEMVAAMDEGIGQMLAALDRQRLRENTLVIFSSDSGGAAPGRVTDNGPLRAGKGTLYEGGRTGRGMRGVAGPHQGRDDRQSAAAHG